MTTAASLKDNLNTTDKDKDLDIFCLIWLDANPNAQDIRDTEQKLSSIINQLKKFQNVEECQNFIEERTENDRITMIVSGQFGREIVPSVHKLRQVISIYVYCLDKVRNKEWADKFAKVNFF